MEYDIRIETANGSRRLAVVRRRASSQQLSRVVPECCGLVWSALRSHGITGAGRHVAVYLDGQINLEVGVEMDGPFAGCGEVVASALPAGTVATAVHFGPYNRLGEAHRAIVDWCAKHGHALAGPNWEIYGHWVDAWNSDRGGIRTDVYYLVTPSSESAG